MTTIISRLYPDASAAEAARTNLLNIGQDDSTIRIITAQTAGGAEAAMKAARLGSVAIAAYAKAMTGDQTLLVVQAPFNPVGTARDAIKCLRRHPALNVGLDDEDIYLREYPTAERSGTVMTNHPLLMSNPFRTPTHGHIFGNHPILHGKARTSAIRGGAYMSRFFWPMKLTSAPKTGTSAIRGGFLISSMLGLPLLTGTWAPRKDLPTILR